MTRIQDKTAVSIVKKALTQDRDFFVAVLQPLIQEALEHQMALFLGASKTVLKQAELLCDGIGA